MNPDLSAALITSHLIERRRVPRFRYAAPIYIKTKDREIRAMSVEISESGASLMTSASLTVGDIVDLEPVGGGAAKAIIRRNQGKLYGVEFLALSSEQTMQIHKICSKLPTFRSKTFDLWAN